MFEKRLDFSRDEFSVTTAIERAVTAILGPASR